MIGTSTGPLKIVFQAGKTVLSGFRAGLEVGACVGTVSFDTTGAGSTRDKNELS